MGVGFCGTPDRGTGMPGGMAVAGSSVAWPRLAPTDILSTSLLCSRCFKSIYVVLKQGPCRVLRAVINLQTGSEGAFRINLRGQGCLGLRVSHPLSV